MTFCKSTTNTPATRTPALWVKEPLAHVKRVIAIASGKGGVGKSTATVCLARAMTQAGKRVGILDADIYGPSIPHMLALSGKPEFAEKMIPLKSDGIACMSMAFITGDQAAILRGPMITKTLNQMLRMTAWAGADAPMDVLFVDMPPGTGDIHLSMAQQVPLSGAIIVTTPQEVALLDARKCAQMFVKVGVPILGIIENMSGGIFGEGGGKKLAELFQAPLLGSVPLDSKLVSATDRGEAYAPEAYGDIVRAIMKNIK